MTSFLLSVTLLLPQTPGRLNDKELERPTGSAEVVIVAQVKVVEPTFAGQFWSGLSMFSTRSGKSSKARCPTGG